LKVVAENQVGLMEYAVREWSAWVGLMSPLAPGPRSLTPRVGPLLLLQQQNNSFLLFTPLELERPLR